tara:strand:- start:1448 stop:1666 length:219 start_codon:yes stop_codon:yes gene_type:complete
VIYYKSTKEIMQKFWSEKSQIRLIKKALKASDRDPFLYKEEEIIKLKTSLRDLREKVESTRRFNNGGFGYAE